MKINLLGLGPITALLLSTTVMASAADMPIKAPPAPSPVWSWTGVQIGVQAGGLWAHTDWRNTTIDTNNARANFRGGFAGVRVGADYQFNVLVVGASAEYNGSRASGRLGPFAIGNQADFANFRLRNFGSVDGRVGFAVGQMLVYGIGGYAFTSLDHTYFGNGGVTQAVFPTRSYHGWDVGAGVDFALSQNLIGRVEYRHYAFRTEDFAALGVALAAHNVALTSNTVRVGISYRFGGPISARY